MKKHYVFALAFAATLSLGACSSDNDLDHGFDGNSELVEADGQVLKLCVESGGTRAASRAGRPLLSAQAKQNINQIDLYVVNKDTKKLVLKKTIGAAEWEQALDYTQGGHGKELQIAFRASENQNLPAANYTIYAIGYNAAEMNFKDIISVELPQSGITTLPTTTTENGSNAVEFKNGQSTPLTALLKDAGKPAEEIFAGQVDVKVVVNKNENYLTTPEADKKAVPTLILNRQVAGVTGYFTNLPAKVGEYVPAKLRLVASGKSDKLFFTSLELKETAPKVNLKNVINGAQSVALDKDASFWGSNNLQNAYTVYEIELSSFFPQLKNEPVKDFSELDLDKDGYVGYKDAQFYVYGKAPSIEELKSWSKDINGENLGINRLEDFWKNPNEKQTLVAGSIFAGRFVIPFGLTAKTHTFELQLVTADNVVLKTWNVGVKDSEKAADPIFAAGVKNAAEENATADDKLIYNIYRNHMYSMGMKAIDAENPEKPGEPDPDPKPNPDPKPDPDKPTDPNPDKPEDLSKGQDLLIHVNDNWEIIHDMEID